MSSIVSSTISGKSHETCQALITLNQLVKDAEKLTEEQYGNAESWAEFQAALKAANDILTSEEPSLKDLQKVGCRLTGSVSYPDRND